MLNDKVIRIAFLISFAGHCLFLGMPKFNLNLPQSEKPEEVVVKIEIEKPPLLPEIDVMGEEKKLREVVEEPELSEPVPEPEEVVIEEPVKEFIEEVAEVIDPAREAMLRYQDMVKQRIESVRRYPFWAQRQEIEGTVYISFVVLSNGLSHDIKIIRPSGFNILDEEAAATIKRAGLFPPIPEKIGTSSVRMEVAIVFTLE